MQSECPLFQGKQTRFEGGKAITSLHYLGGRKLPPYTVVNKQNKHKTRVPKARVGKHVEKKRKNIKHVFLRHVPLIEICLRRVWEPLGYIKTQNCIPAHYFKSIHISRAFLGFTSVLRLPHMQST